MATRLFSDLLSGSGRRYFYDLDSAPGVCTPGVGTLTLNGQEPQYPGIAFRTPATLTLTLNGRSVNPDFILTPAPAALAFSSSVVGLQTVRLIQPTLPSPVESPDNDFVPTLIQIFHREPITGVITLGGFSHSLSEGGNIGFRSPDTAALSLLGYQYLRSIPPVDGQATAMFIEGREPTLVTELLVEPLVGVMGLGTQTASPEGENPVPPIPPPPPVVDKGFVWLDDDPSPPLQWT
jgi:hypothetical protein